MHDSFLKVNVVDSQHNERCECVKNTDVHFFSKIIISPAVSDRKDGPIKWLVARIGAFFLETKNTSRFQDGATENEAKVTELTTAVVELQKHLRQASQGELFNVSPIWCQSHWNYTPVSIPGAASKGFHQ